jgi:ribonuclease P protein subunit POP4
MKKEIIGLDLVVAASANKQLVGAKGRVIDETKNTITINDGTKERTIIKDNNDFIIGGERVKGKNITQRPEDRIKK